MRTYIGFGPNRSRRWLPFKASDPKNSKNAAPGVHSGMPERRPIRPAMEQVIQEYER